MIIQKIVTYTEAALMIIGMIAYIVLWWLALKFIVVFFIDLSTFTRYMSSRSVFETQQPAPVIIDGTGGVIDKSTVEDGKVVI